ncbi:recombination protein RecR [Candidatus Kaiserbacteria bacterium]|nr:MAG: recombination protein RecR [Candidatus Kaiserbacteria bacterium]
MNDLDTLTELFTQFPGIGPRQARRFVFFLLRQNEGYRNTFIRAIQNTAAQVKQCSRCLRYAQLHVKTPICDLCADSSRADDLLMLVEKDTDVEQMEKSGAYTGRYFVLGGTFSLTGKKSYIREKELTAFLKKHGFGLTEIILALSATPDGEYTTDYLTTKFKEDPELTGATVTVLGRGLSTGSELEYADAATLKQALKNRV